MISCPPVRQIVCNVGGLPYNHTRWNSSKIISRLISLTFLLSVDPSITDLLQREHPNSPNFSLNTSEIRKIVDFRYLGRRISETVQDMVQVAIDH